MARCISKTEPRGRIPQLYRDMKIGDRVIVKYEYKHAFHLLRSAWKRHYRQQMIADGYDVPWLYLEPAVARVNGEVIEATMVVRVADEVECWAKRKKFLKEGVT